MWLDNRLSLYTGTSYFVIMTMLCASIWSALHTRLEQGWPCQTRIDSVFAQSSDFRKNSFIKLYFENSNYIIGQPICTECWYSANVSYVKLLALVVLYLGRQWELFFRPLRILAGREQLLDLLPEKAFSQYLLIFCSSFLDFISKDPTILLQQYSLPLPLAPIPASPRNHAKPMEVWLPTSTFLACWWTHPQCLLNFENNFYLLLDGCESRFCPKSLSQRLYVGTV